MSWDIFVFQLPPGIRRAEEVPPGFEPGPMGRRADLAAAIHELYPEADFTDPSWGRLDRDGAFIEISLGAEEERAGLAFHVHGGPAAVAIIAAVLDRLGLQALDPSSETRLFDPEASRAGFRRWQEYRDKVVGRRWSQAMIRSGER